MSLKDTVKSVPVVGPAARWVYLKMKGRDHLRFDTSGQYWEDRYRLGGNSGAGSYNRLAHFKADFLNRFVTDHGVISVIEFGSGDGAQLRLAKYPRYIGVDVSQTVIAATRAAFTSDPTISFLHVNDVTQQTKADLSMSLDVIYHLIEDATYETYMARLFDAAERYVIVYASNMDQPWHAAHVRHRKFTDWVEAKRPDFTLVERVPNAYPYSEEDSDNTSFADFYIFRRTSAAS